MTTFYLRLPEAAEEADAVASSSLSVLKWLHTFPDLKSVADLGEGPGGPTPPPLLILGNKRRND